MKLRPEKIDQLAREVADKILSLETVEVRGDRQTLEHNIREAILDDLAAEEDLEDEVTRMLTAALQGRSRDSVNYAELFRKAKKELARKRGMVI